VTALSTWREWNDEDGNGHFHVTLTPADQRAMSPSKYEALIRARETIKWAFTPEDET
jgi:hypothetical protein